MNLFNHRPRAARLPLFLALTYLPVAAGVAAAQVTAPTAAGRPESYAATPLTLDPAVRAGTLANGLRYYVRRNARPAKRAELRLAVNAGSILETDAQRGVAHFVEHMAFNGTRRFPKSMIVDYLERIGMRFGADLNAYTSFDETVYMLQVPTDTAALLATGLDILEDWAQAVTFDTAEIRKERGVVIEEWRTGRDAATRISYRQLPVVLNNSLYADRLPIGTRENLESFPDSLARAFYRDWYRPDLMTIVAVGDFDADSMVVGITRRFGAIPVPTNPRPRTVATVPRHADTFVSIESDKEYPSGDVTLLWLMPHTVQSTVGDLRKALVARFGDSMLNQRFAELARRPDAPFAYAGVGHGQLVRTRDAFQLAAGVKGSGFVPAASALLTEMERARRFGFTTSELERTRTNYLRSLEQRFAERDNTESAAFASAYVSMALGGSPVIGIEKEIELARALVPAITLDEVNAAIRQATPDSNRVVLVAAPDQPGIELPTRDQLLGIYRSGIAADLTAYVDSTSDAPLIERLPAPGRIVQERALPETGILEWTLSNGARVLVKETDFKADEVLFAAQSPGGSSLARDSDFLDASFGMYAVADGGLAEFNSTALQKKLAGKRASVAPSVGLWSEGLVGGGSRKDLETIFQLAYLRFTAPRVDSASFGSFINLVRSLQANQDNDPESVFADTISVTLAQHDPHLRLLRAAVLDSVNIERALTLYRERFANAGDFTFFLVGSFDLDSARLLTERYLASLPATSGREQPRDLGLRLPPGVVERTVHKGVEPKATTEVIFHGRCDYSYPNRIVLDALQDLLDIRLREVLREDKSGTYGVGVAASCSHIPYPRYTISVSFGSAPERREELMNAMWTVIDSLKAGAISDSNLVKIREMATRSHETALRRNDAWMAAMRDADEDGRDQRDWLRSAEMTARVTREQLQAAAKAYLNRESMAVFVLVPETPTTSQPTP